VEGRQSTRCPVLSHTSLSLPPSLTLHPLPPSPSLPPPSPSTTSQIKRTSSSSSGSGSSGRPVPPPRTSQTILGTDLLPQNGSLKGPGSTSQKSGSDETSLGGVNKAGAGAVVKNAGPGKMIKRVYLFADDPNSIEVLANEGDQALIMYVLLSRPYAPCNCAMRQI
jgi:hypothetical protein